MPARPHRRALPTPLVAAALGLLACTEPPELSSNRGLSFEAWKAQQYREPGTGLYILDGDTPVAGDQLFALWSAWQADQLSVYRVNGADVVWSSTQKRNLTYCVSNAFGANKARVVTALRDATESGWEMFADIDFKYLADQDGNCTAGNNAVLFDVNPVNANGEYLARAFFPNSPRGERNVLIDPSAFQPGPWPLKNILAHELGHALGFRHEHIRPESGATQCFEDNQYRGITAYDSASVMHYPQCNGSSQDLSFTMLDRQGVAMLYGAFAPNPAPMVQFSAPQDGDTVGVDFVVTGNVVDTDLQSVDLLVDGAVVDTLTDGSSTFDVTGQVEGSHSLELVATDTRGQVTRKVIHVTVQRPATGGDDDDGGGGGGGEGGEAPYIVGGCSAGGAAGWPVALLGLGLIARRRRRR